MTEIAVGEFHHVSVDSDNKLGQHLGQLIARDKTADSVTDLEF
jgi:hypothetical protein